MAVLPEVGENTPDQLVFRSPLINVLKRSERFREQIDRLTGVLFLFGVIDIDGRLFTSKLRRR